MVVKHCCYGLCRSDSRYKDRPHMQNVRFLLMPQVHKDPVKASRWAEACGRVGFTERSISMYTYICTKHFVGENGPTEAHPDPIPALTQVKRTPGKKKTKPQPQKKRKNSTKSRKVLKVKIPKRKTKAKPLQDSAGPASEYPVPVPASNYRKGKRKCLDLNRRNTTSLTALTNESSFSLEGDVRPVGFFRNQRTPASSTIKREPGCLEREAPTYMDYAEDSDALRHGRFNDTDASGCRGKLDSQVQNEVTVKEEIPDAETWTQYGDDSPASTAPSQVSSSQAMVLIPNIDELMKDKRSPVKTEILYTDKTGAETETVTTETVTNTQVKEEHCDVYDAEHYATNTRAYKAKQYLTNADFSIIASLTAAKNSRNAKNVKRRITSSQPVLSKLRNHLVSKLGDKINQIKTENLNAAVVPGDAKQEKKQETKASTCVETQETKASTNVKTQEAKASTHVKTEETKARTYVKTLSSGPTKTLEFVTNIGNLGPCRLQIPLPIIVDGTQILPAVLSGVCVGVNIETGGKEYSLENAAVEKLQAAEMSTNVVTGGREHSVTNTAVMEQQVEEISTEVIADGGKHSVTDNDVNEEATDTRNAR